MNSRRDERTTPLVLVVDDYEDARDLYAEYLRVSGYEVAVAGNGREAVADVTALMPDLVLMDLSLPGLDGWEASRRIKADPRTRHVPIVALTGHALASAAARAQDAGCDAVLVKPCALDEVLAEVRRLLDRPQA